MAATQATPTSDGENLPAVLQAKRGPAPIAFYRAPLAEQRAHLLECGKFIAGSGMFGCSNVQQGMVMAAVCGGDLRKLQQFAETFHIIKNKLSMRADAMHARYRALGGRDKWVELTDQRASIRLTYKDNDLTFTFTMEQAERAGLVKEDSNWVKWPEDMLSARVLTRGIRKVCPEATKGFYAAEELGQGLSDFEIYDDGVLEAEFSVVDNKADPQPEPQRTNATKQPTPEPQSEPCCETAAGLSPAQTMLHDAADPEHQAKVQQLLAEIGAYRVAADWSLERYVAALEKNFGGVASARQLGYDDLVKLHRNMKMVAEKAQAAKAAAATEATDAAPGTSEVDGWVNGQGQAGN